MPQSHSPILSRLNDVLSQTTIPAKLTRDTIDDFENRMISLLSIGDRGENSSESLTLEERKAIFGRIVQHLDLANNPDYFLIKDGEVPIGYVPKAEMKNKQTQNGNGFVLSFCLYNELSLYTHRQVLSNGQVLKTSDGKYQLGMVYDGNTTVLYTEHGREYGEYELDKGSSFKKTKDGKYFLRGDDEDEYVGSKFISTEVGEPSFIRLIKKGLVQTTSDGRFEIVGRDPDYSQHAYWLSLPGNLGGPNTLRVLDPKTFAIQTTSDGRFEIDTLYTTEELRSAPNLFNGKPYLVARLSLPGDTQYDASKPTVVLDLDKKPIMTLDGKYFLSDDSDDNEGYEESFALLDERFELVDFGVIDPDTRYPRVVTDPNSGKKYKLVSLDGTKTYSTESGSIKIYAVVEEDRKLTNFITIIKHFVEIDQNGNVVKFGNFTE